MAGFLSQRTSGDAWAEWKIASMLENTSQAAVEFEFMPSVGTWFGLPPRPLFRKDSANVAQARLELSRRSRSMWDHEWDMDHAGEDPFSGSGIIGLNSDTLERAAPASSASIILDVVAATRHDTHAKIDEP